MAGPSESWLLLDPLLAAPIATRSARRSPLTPVFRGDVVRKRVPHQRARRAGAGVPVWSSSTARSSGFGYAMLGSNPKTAQRSGVSQHRTASARCSCRKLRGLAGGIMLAAAISVTTTLVANFARAIGFAGCSQRWSLASG